MVEREKRLNTLIFGQGPVSNEKSLNLWGRELPVAGAILAKARVDSFGIMGGKTMTAETRNSLSESEHELALWPSEAGLIYEGIVDLMPKEKKKEVSFNLEHSSTNTFENLLNSCNEQLDEAGDGRKGDTPVDILGAKFHINRMKLLMKLFDIPYRRGISAVSVIEYSAIEAAIQGRGEIDHETLRDIDRRYDVNAATSLKEKEAEGEAKAANLDTDAKTPKLGVGRDNGYYSAREDPNLLTIVEKMQDEDVWTRALLTIPDYSLPYFAKVKNDARLMSMLRTFDKDFFPATETEQSALAARGVDLLTDTPDEIRAKLSKIKREMPDENERKRWKKEHTEKGWPQEVEDKFNAILA